jgi:peptidoglycan hydrolase-like protein with peptidoglycan-binding domain
MDSAFGRILPIASAGRTYAEQAEAYRKYKNGGPLALPPGQSIHERGNAIDWGYAVYGLLGLYDGTGWRGLTINRNGHRRTVASEVWHTEYLESEDNFRGQGAPAGGASGGPSIRDAQNWLNDNLGAGLTVDGIDGPATQAAVKRYQGILGVAQDGAWGAGTEAAHREQHPANSMYGGAWVRAIQDKLNRLGLGPVTVDGLDGGGTREAVKRFQSANGLAADGIAGPATNNVMDQKLTAAPVGRNATSRSTTEIQNYLKSKGYDLGQYGADGDYGQATTSAVIAFQKDNGLEPDGVWGPLADAKAFPPASVGGNRTTRSTWDIQRLVGATADGIWGQETTDKVKVWQAANGLEADGIWGESSDAEGFPVTNPASSYPTTGRNATTRKTEDIQKLVGAEIDGSYGPNTSVKVAQWQEKNGLDADGVWGPASDAKGFPGVALPDAPKDPAADPTYGKKTPQYPGAAWADISPNKSVRTGKVQALILHHRADTGSAESARKRFMAANDRNVSPNWNVNQDGSADEIVPPDDYRAWTTGQIDHQAVTIETGNTSAEPNWGISGASHERIADILAWAAHRYQFPIQRGAAELRNGENVITVPGLIPHRDTPAGKSTSTVCPGPSMDLDKILLRAKVIYQTKYVDTTTPEPEVPADTVSVSVEFLKNLRANQLSDAEEISKYLP